MKGSQQRIFFTTTVLNWYALNKRNLPWRQTNDPYFIWLSEIILQQTQVKQGLPYYLKFIKAYPTIYHLANANEENVLKLWQGLGYYTRARNLHATAKHIVTALNGQFPNTYKELLALKGIGDYTASAIASISFNQPTAVVDGNVYRVLARYFGISTAINSTEGKKTFKTLAQSLLSKKMPAQYNQAIMEFGALQCKPKNYDCTICPLNQNCVAYKTDSVAKLPVKIKPLKPKTSYYNFLVVIDNLNNTLLERRSAKGIWRNLYQFPLIETNKKASKADLIKLINKHETIGQYTYQIIKYNKTAITHKLSHKHLLTTFWILKINQSIPQSIPISSLKKYPVPVLIANFLDVLIQQEF